MPRGRTTSADGEKRSGRTGNLLLLFFILLGCSLLMLPALQMVLEDPSKRALALVVGFGALAVAMVLISIPRRRWEEGMLGRHDLEEADDRSGDPEEREMDKIASLIELRSVVVRRMQIRRRMDDKELRSVMKSQKALNALLADEMLEELVLEDPRYLAWKMEQKEDFMDSYERLLTRVEVWR